MQALWLENQTLTFRASIPAPEPQAREALIKINLAGICGTDLELVRGYYPYSGIPGHEFVGTVLDSSEGEWIGERVVGEINLACGKCTQCKAERSNHCEQRKVLGLREHPGVFTEFITLPLENLHRVSSGITDEVAVFTEPLAAALEIQQQVEIRPGDRVLLVGSGRLGLLIAMTIALTGCNFLVTARRERARGLLAAYHIHSISPEEIPQHQIDVVIDASGSPQGFNLARGAVRPGGIIILKSTYTGATEINLSEVVVDEVTLIGSRCGPFAPALRFFESGMIDPTPLIDATYPLREGLAAFDYAAKPGALKVLLRP